MMDNDDLVIQRIGSDLHVVGVLDVSDLLKPLVGIKQACAVSEVSDEVGLRAGVVEHIIHGAELINGKHVKFASPIVISGSAIKKESTDLQLQTRLKRKAIDSKETQTGAKDVPLADPRIEQLFAPQSEPEKVEKTMDNNNSDASNTVTKRGSVTISYDPYDRKAAGEAIQMTETIDYISQRTSAEFTKEARKYINTPFFESLHDAKVDGNSMGLGNMKVVFGPDAEGIKSALLLLSKRESKSASLADCVVTPISSIVANLRRNKGGRR